MDQKLQNLFLSVPSRTAWIIIGSCAAYWALCFSGLLTPPVTAPPDIALFWFYAMLMLALASGLAAVALGGLLLVRRQSGTGVPLSAPRTPMPAGDAEDEDRDQIAGLGRMLDGPGDATVPTAAPTAGPPARPVPPAKSPKREQRRRRR